MSAHVFANQFSSTAGASSIREFSVSMRLSLADVGALWAVAADKLMQSGDLDMDDVIDVIGPQEDPSLADCLAVVVGPVPPAGCEVRDFSIEEVVPQGDVQAEAATLAA
ncbi:hypothetical protein [Stakelama marina]|uniref:Uncharacterized protein n=1 Tax=Stakelama marina TaxID=2826939 RepID=A0A8T4I995_9SPHN|nr:hypothetical protein [Stakelama marina]MBR0550931.1 hypothetical protein [Stakelama marina]